MSTGDPTYTCPCCGQPCYRQPTTAGNITFSTIEKQAVLCPVCKGAGKLSTGKATSAGEFFNACHGCGGIGWVKP
jgi:hypothetical protein